MQTDGHFINGRIEKDEARIQQDCYVWFHNSFPELRGLLCYNLNNSKNMVDGALNKSKGLVKGRSDMEFNYMGVTTFIELKTPNGFQSQEQKEWQKKIELQGFKYHIVRNLEEFQKVIEDVLQHTKILE